MARVNADEIKKKIDNLYEIGADMQNIQNAIERGEMTTFDGKPVKDLMKEKLANEVEEVVLSIRNLNGDIDKLDREIKRLQSMKAETEDIKEKYKEEIKQAMKDLNMKTVKTAFGNLTLRKPMPSIVIKDEANIPLDFKKEVTEIKIDKKALLKHFKETGEIVEGTEVVHKSSLLVPKVRGDK